MRVLVLNSGSSTLKAALIEPPAREPLAATTVELGIDASALTRLTGPVAAAVDALGGRSADAVGHRVVHGGTEFTALTPLDDAALDAIADLAPLAPLHNPVAVAVARAAMSLLPSVPHVACFDTAFHATLPELGYRYPVPEQWFVEWGVRRFGFHGLSVAWSVRRAGELLGRDPAALGVVVAHLGSGCSVTAVDGGRSVDTSMGMTPLEGLMMGTRAGSIDPGILLRLLREQRLDVDDLAEALDHGSGLAGVSARTSDVRELLRLEAAGDHGAMLALGLFVRRAAAGIAAAATTLPSLDAVVFTGGIGEHAGAVRARIVERLGVLGLPPIEAEAGDDDAVLAAGPPAVLRVEAREDLVIATEVAASIAG